MRASLKPLRVSPHAQPFLVDMIARTGKGKIKVQGLNSGAPIFAAERFRLYDPGDYRRQISAEEFARLPWQGAGPDPDKAAIEELLDYAARPTDEADGKARIEDAMTGRGQ